MGILILAIHLIRKIELTHVLISVFVLLLDSQMPNEDKF